MQWNHCDGRSRSTTKPFHQNLLKSISVLSSIYILAVRRQRASIARSINVQPLNPRFLACLIACLHWLAFGSLVGWVLGFWLAVGFWLALVGLGWLWLALVCLALGGFAWAWLGFACPERYSCRLADFAVSSKKKGKSRGGRILRAG